MLAETLLSGAPDLGGRIATGFVDVTMFSKIASENAQTPPNSVGQD
jgi:hypothetical protein